MHFYLQKKLYNDLKTICIKEQSKHIVVFLLLASLISSIIPTTSSYSQHELEPPLKQIKSGVLDSDVKCLDDFTLIFSASDLSPACVRQSNVSLLMARGWITITSDDNINVEDNSTSRNYALVFLVNYESQQYNNTLTSIVKHLKSGDYLLIEGYGDSVPMEQYLQKIKSFTSPGVNVGMIRIYNSIDALVKNLSILPKGFNYIGYDYEGGDGFSPEFTTNETISIKYFDQAENAVHKYNEKTGSDSKLLVAPPYGELKNANWNWGIAAQHMDVMDIQFQAFIKDAKFLDYVLDAIAQIKQESPSTKIFVQLSLIEKRGTAQDNLNSINVIRNLPIDGFLMFYHPYQTSELDQFFQIMPKHS